MLPINRIKKSLTSFKKYKFQNKELEEISDLLYQLAELMIEQYLKEREKKSNVTKT